MKNWVEQCRDTSGYGYFGYTRLEGVLCHFHIIPFLTTQCGLIQVLSAGHFLRCTPSQFQEPYLRSLAFIPAGTLSRPPPTHTIYTFVSAVTLSRNLALAPPYSPPASSALSATGLSPHNLLPTPNLQIGTVHSNLESGGDDTTSCFKV